MSNIDTRHAEFYQIIIDIDVSVSCSVMSVLHRLLMLLLLHVKNHN